MKSTLSNHLSPSRLECVTCLEETESTNTYLKSLAETSPHGQCVIARRQSEGRGRVGNSFASPDGGLYLSLLYRLGDSPAAFTACAAVAVRRAIRAVCGLEAEIKWVNDLVLGGKKVCGILTEMHCGALIVGVGVNVNTASFPPELPHAGSLAQIGGRECPVEALAAAIIGELDAVAEAFPKNTEAYRGEYAAACLNLGREVLLRRPEGDSRAFAEAIDDDFSLVVRRSDGSRERIFYGEVSVRGETGEYV